MIFFKAFPICSNITCNGLTEFTSSISPLFAISFTISKASSKFPSIETISAPYITACDNLPNAILPSGITTIAFKPALAAYAAADADVFPVEAHITIFLPCSFAFVTAITIPRSLNEPVGLAPSYFTYKSIPSILDIFSQ